MLTSKKTIYYMVAFTATVFVAACTGGGGGGAALPPPPASSPTPHPSAPAPSPTAALNGTLQVVNGGSYPNPTYTAASATSVEFSCGCTSFAGVSTTDASGNFTLVAVSTPIPTPAPMYTIVPGRNYLIVANPTSGSQAWTMEFAGHVPSHNQSLNATNPSDIYTAAVTLYMFQYSISSATAFDDWNFNTLAAWYAHLKAGPITGAETTLLTDIVSQSSAGNTLWPTPPPWHPSQAANVTIRADLSAVHAGGTGADPNLPTPCPGGPGTCTNTPNP